MRGVIVDSHPIKAITRDRVNHDDLLTDFFIDKVDDASDTIAEMMKHVVLNTKFE